MLGFIKGRYQSAVVFSSLVISMLNISASPVKSQEIDLPPEVIQESPVLQRWLKEVPNVLEQIQNDPSFTTKVQLGYFQFSGEESPEGVEVGIEDWFVGQTNLTINANYQGSFAGNYQSVAADVSYYLLPLGGYINIAPVIGYRYLQKEDFHSDGLNLGAKLILPLSRTGAADISVSQNFVAVGTAEEVGITKVTLGYAVTKDLRLAGLMERQNSTQGKDTRWGVLLEWVVR